MSDVFDAYAAYYDLLYAKKDYTGEANRLLVILAQHGISNGSILELGSGTGRHAMEFSERGFSVLGVDNSPRMVDLANQRKCEAGIDDVTFSLGDVRFFNANRKFDAVLSIFHVASYQRSYDDLDGMFGTAASHLLPGGLFVFDFWYGPGVLKERPSVRVKRIGNESIKVTRIAEPVMNPHLNTVDVNYEIWIYRREDGDISCLSETHTMRYWFAPELNCVLEKHGFIVVSNEAWNGGELGDDTWDGLCVAKKSGEK